MIRIHPVPPRRSERGIALVAALLVMVLVSVLALSFMLVTTGERRISSNVHTAKGALYAADAGVRVAQQKFANYSKAKLDSLCNAWSGTGAVIASPTTFFPAGATVVSATNPQFSASATIAFADSDLNPTSQVYNYTYTITAVGSRGLFGSRRVQSQGILRVSAERGNFSDYLIFTNTHLMADGSAIWFTSSGYFDGRVHTNGEFRFGYQPTFQDRVESVNSKAWYYNLGSPKELAANNNGTRDVPNFFGGFYRSAPTVTLPANSFNQQAAALGLDTGGSAPTNPQINGALGLGSGGSAPPNGIYLVNSGGAVTGGLYVQGALTQCTMSLDASNNQVYTLKQGTTTKTVTVNRTANTTSVKVGSTTTTYTGLPRGIIYTNGAISDLRGPDRVSGSPPPAVANGTELIVAATGDIILQRDITYQDYNAASSVLGIFSSGGSVRVGTSAPSDMYLDAYVMATGTSGAFEVDNYDGGSPRGTFHLRGGMVASYYGGFYTFDNNGTLQTGYARNFSYDRRGLMPPYYPITTRYEADAPAARTVSWKEM